MLRLHLPLLFCLALFASPAFPQDSLNVTKVGEFYYWSSAIEATIDGNYAYVANGTYGLRIVDITTPGEPIEVGYCDLMGSAQSVAIQDTIAYVACLQEGLRIVDISDHTNPVEIGFYDTQDWVDDVVVSGNYAYIAHFLSGLLIIDVSDPYNPIEVGSFYQSPGAYTDIDISGDKVYISSGWEFRVILVEDPSEPIPRQISQLSMSSSNCGLEVVGDYVYIAAWDDGLRIVDISDPMNPLLITEYDLPGSPMEIDYENGFVYVAAMDSGLHIVNVSDPYSPIHLGSIVFSDEARGVAANDSIVCIAADLEGIRMVDISNPSVPLEIGYYNHLFTASSVFCTNDYAYLVGGTQHSGLSIVNIQNPVNPIETAISYLPESARDVAVLDGFAYVADYYDGLLVFDVSDSSNPFLVSSFGGILNTTGIEISCNNAFITGYYSFHIIDISNPLNPIEVGYCSVPGYCIDSYIVENIAYVVSGSGIRLIDFTDPTNPIEIGYYDPPDFSPTDIVVSGDYGFSTSENYISGGLYVLNVNEPTSIYQVAYYGLGEYANNLFLLENYVYVTCRYDGLFIFDVFNPEYPELTGYYDTPGTARGVFTVDEYVYVAEDSYFCIYNCSAALPVENSNSYELPSTYSLNPSFPNPFNPTTTLTYHLPKAASVELNVYDVIGSLVGTLSSGWHPAGAYNVVFDGADLASGVYLARFTAGDFTQTQKLVLLK